MSDPLIIQCAVTGSADPHPQRRPNLPITSEQIVGEHSPPGAPAQRSFIFTRVRRMAR